LEQITRLLSEARLPDVALEKGRLTITPLKADVPEQVEEWSDRLYDLLPRIHLTDLLMEVDSWIHFSRCFTHLYTQQPAADRSLAFAGDPLGCHQHWPQEDRRRHAGPVLCQTELGRRLVCSRRELR